MGRTETAVKATEEDAELAIVELKADYYGDYENNRATYSETMDYVKNKLKGEGYKTSGGATIKIAEGGNITYTDSQNNTTDIIMNDDGSVTVWDNATPEDCFIWASDVPGEEGYGTVIGYARKIDDYPIVKFPTRCNNNRMESVCRMYKFK